MMQRSLISTTGAAPFRKVALKSLLSGLLLCASLLAAAQARASKRPDACGDGKVKFDVYTEGHQPAPARPAAGWAQIVLIEDQNQAAYYQDATVRFGLDGEWVGASKGKSYFVVAENPGVHRLCASMQDESNVELATVTAEADKVYYLEAKVEVHTTGTPISDSPPTFTVTLTLAPLSEEEGQDRVAAWKRATPSER
jgi:hypothetical protein